MSGLWEPTAEPWVPLPADEPWRDWTDDEEADDDAA